jgi:hypothetical protein
MNILGLSHLLEQKLAPKRTPHLKLMFLLNKLIIKQLGKNLQPFQRMILHLTIKNLPNNLKQHSKQHGETILPDFPLNPKSISQELFETGKEVL